MRRNVARLWRGGQQVSQVDWYVSLFTTWPTIFALVSGAVTAVIATWQMLKTLDPVLAVSVGLILFGVLVYLIEGVWRLFRWIVWGRKAVDEITKGRAIEAVKFLKEVLEPAIEKAEVALRWSHKRDLGAEDGAAELQKYQGGVREAAKSLADAMTKFAEFYHKSAHTPDVKASLPLPDQKIPEQLQKLANAVGLVTASLRYDDVERLTEGHRDLLGMFVHGLRQIVKTATDELMHLARST